MSTLSDAVAAATAPYRGATYYATGPKYYAPTQTASYIDDLNSRFNLSLTPEEVTSGIQQFGDWHRGRFGYPVSQSPNPESWANQNGVGNFTDLSDPFAIARESIGDVLRNRGLAEDAIQSNFYSPLQTFSQNSTDTYQKAADGLSAAQKAAWKSQNPDLGGMGFGSIIGDLLSNPVVLALGGAALGGSGLLSGLFEGAGAAGLGETVGADILTGGLGSAATGLEGYGLGATGATGGLGSIASQWAALEGTPTLVMGGDAAAGGLGAFTSAGGFGTAPAVSDFPLTQDGELAFDDAMQQGTGFNSPDTPWNTLNRTLNQALAENPMLDQGLNAAKTIKSAANVYNTVDGIYDMLTTEPQVQQAPLQQIQEQRRGAMTQPFGNRNFDLYR